MEEKKYLKGWQKLAYGAGDFGSNFMYTFVSAFVVIYLTDTVGLNSGIIGTLMLLSKCLDGVTDVFFGRLMDRTKSKWGKARPWMFWSVFPLAVCEILLFSTPQMEQKMQYAYFFVVYTLLNSIFYTANNISYAALTALMTKNPHERVQAGTYRFMFVMLAGILIPAMTTGLVGAFGGGTAGWRSVAVIYTIVMVAFNMLVVFSVKEVTDEGEKAEDSDGITFLQSIRMLVGNRYYLLILAFYLLQYGMQGVTNGVGIFFCTYALGNPDALGLLSFAGGDACACKEIRDLSRKSCGNAVFRCVWSGVYPGRLYWESAADAVGAGSARSWNESDVGNAKRSDRRRLNLYL